MPEVNLGLAGLAASAKNDQKQKKNLNFISSRPDPVRRIVEWANQWGIWLAIIVVAGVIGTSAGQLYLRTRLNAVNEQLNSVGDQLQGKTAFVNQFLTTQAKLAVYGQSIGNEKMVELFPILNALIPEGVQISELSIEPNTVEVVCTVSSDQPLIQFANNIRGANGLTTADGSLLTVNNVTAKGISQNTYEEKSTKNTLTNYDMSLTFNYAIK